MKDFAGWGSCRGGIDPDRNVWMNKVQNKQNTSADTSLVLVYLGPLEHRDGVFSSWPSSLNLLSRRRWRSDISASWQTDFLFPSDVRLIPDNKILKHYVLSQLFHQICWWSIFNCCIWSVFAVFVHLTRSFMIIHIFLVDYTSDDSSFIFNTDHKRCREDSCTFSFLVENRSNSTGGRMRTGRTDPNRQIQLAAWPRARVGEKNKSDWSQRCVWERARAFTEVCFCQS